MTATGAVLGTPDFMSPEQARGTTCDERSDIFSVGAVLYLMLSGRTPFKGPDYPAVLHKVVWEDPPPLLPEEAPPALARIVVKALAKEPEQRYQDFRALSGDLSRWRRRYAVETRAFAAEVARRLDQLPELVASERECASALGMAPGYDLDRWRGEIAAGHPPLESGGVEALKTGLWTRETVDQVGGRVKAIVAAAEPRIASLRSAAATMAAAAAHLDNGDAHAALAGLEQVQQSVPDAEVQPLMERARALIAAEQARAARLRILLEDAAAARTGGQLDRALALVSEALRLDPHNAEARQALTLIQQDRATADADRSRRCERSLERARRAIRLDQFDEAERQLGLARETGVAAAQVEAAYASLAEARSAREAVDAEMKEITGQLALARGEFQDGRRAAARQRLTDLTVQYPSNAAAQVALARLRTEDERLTAAEQTLARAEELALQAAQELASDNPDAAVQLAEQALSLAPSHAQALKTSALAHARVRERSEHAGRAERSKRHIDAARDFLERGKFDRAIKEARRAAELDPHSGEASAVVGEAVRRQTDAASAEVRGKEAVDRANELRELMASAGKALRSGDFVRARALAEQAVAADPDSPEPRALITAIATAAALEARKLDDDTVELAPAHADTDDTVALPRYPAGLRHRARFMRAWILVVWAGAVVWFRMRLDRSGKSAKSDTPADHEGRKES